MILLTFDEGTFAGKTIRITNEHFASAYDVMRVAGVTNLSGYWKVIKHGIDEENRKVAKFAGPVLNGKGVMQMLLILPDSKVRKFVAEAAQILVRHLGGDDFLLNTLKRNRDVPAVDTIHKVEMSIALDERRQNVRRLTMDNDAQELSLLEQYKQYALNNVTDPRFKKRIQDGLANRLVSMNQNFFSTY